MIFGSPASWVLYEALSVILFVACLAHAARSSRPVSGVLMLVGFVIYAGTFENIGVWADIYDYNLDRLLMVGKVPLSILFVESVVFYAAMWLTRYLRMPWWSAPFAVGFLGSFQDLTIDPSNVFDLYVVNGVSSGQWNWTMHYDGGLFGIPFFNFTGWLTMMLYYAFLIRACEVLARKWQRPALDTYAPLIAFIPALILLVSPVNLFLLYAWPIGGDGNMVAEIVMLVLTYAVGIFFLFRHGRIREEISLRADGLMLAVPVVLRLWDVIIAYALGVQQGMLPSVLFGAIHVVALAVLWSRSRRFKTDAPSPAVG